MGIEVAISQAGGAGFAPPERVEARLMPWAAGMAVVGWAIALMVGLTIFYFGRVMGSFVPGLAVPLTVSGAALSAWCAWHVWRCWRIRQADRPTVIVSPAGFEDTRIGRLIPWAEIERLTSDQPGTRSYLRLYVREPKRFLHRRTPLWRGAARVAADGALVSSLSELEATPQAIIAAAEAYRTSCAL